MSGTINWNASPMSAEAFVERYTDMYFEHVEAVAHEGVVAALGDAVRAIADLDACAFTRALLLADKWHEALEEARWGRVHRKVAEARWADDGGRA